MLNTDCTIFVSLTGNFKLIFLRRFIMKWETPAYSDIRFGFEVTMYINNK